MNRYLLLTLLLTGCAKEQFAYEPAPVPVSEPEITMVELCPGLTPAYPSTFPEYAMCVHDSNGGTLYAVYSANGGFETELPPGKYQSTGIPGCVFIVGPNCQISY